MAGTGVVLRPYQARVFAALARGIARRRGETFTVLFPRQAGKNELASVLVAFLLRAHARAGGSIVLCAPTMSPQAEISIARVRRTLGATDALAGEVARARLGGNTITVGRASATFLSASPEAHVAGHTASLALIADEAQEIDAEWFDRQFRPMAASTGAPSVLFGTPWDGRSLLDRAVAANRARDALEAGAPYRDFLPLHHEVAWPEVARSNPGYGEYVRHERRRLGAGHPLYVSQYELRTVEAEGRLLTPAQLVRLEGTHPGLRAPVPGERYVGALDCAGEGARADASVLTIGRIGAGGRCEVVRQVAWRSAAYARLTADVAAIARHWRLERLVVDATGLGGPIAARLAESLGPRVAPFAFTAASKATLGFALIAAIETARLLLHADDGSREAGALRAELAACGGEFTPGGGLRWGNARGHDDFVASLALCLHAAEAAGPGRRATGRSRE